MSLNKDTVLCGILLSYTIPVKNEIDIVNNRNKQWIRGFQFEIETYYFEIFILIVYTHVSIK